jgi:hypothetical protein
VEVVLMVHASRLDIGHSLGLQFSRRALKRGHSLLVGFVVVRFVDVEVD